MKKAEALVERVVRQDVLRRWHLAEMSRMTGASLERREKSSRPVEQWVLRCKKRSASLKPNRCEGERPEVDTAIWTGATSHHTGPAWLVWLFAEGSNARIDICIRKPLWLVCGKWMSGRPIRRKYYNSSLVRGDSGLDWGCQIWHGKKWIISEYILELEPTEMWTSV